MRRPTVKKILRGFSGKRMKPGGMLEGQRGIKNNKTVNIQISINQCKQYRITITSLWVENMDRMKMQGHTGL